MLTNFISMDISKGTRKIVACFLFIINYIKEILLLKSKEMFGKDKDKHICIGKVDFIRTY